MFTVFFVFGNIYTIGAFLVPIGNEKYRRKECHEKVYRIFKESIVQSISNYIIYRIITGFVFTIQLL